MFCWLENAFARSMSSSFAAPSLRPSCVAHFFLDFEKVHRTPDKNQGKKRLTTGFRGNLVKFVLTALVQKM